MAQEECEAVSVHWFFTPNEAHASFPHETRGLETRMQLRIGLEHSPNGWRLGTAPRANLGFRQTQEGVSGGFVTMCSSAVLDLVVTFVLLMNNFVL